MVDIFRLQEAEDIGLRTSETMATHLQHQDTVLALVAMSEAFDKDELITLTQIFSPLS
jgi:hypothetical protein